MTIRGRYFISQPEVAPHPPYSNYPDELLGAMQIARLIGPKGDILEEDIRITDFQLDPGTHYAAHAHPHPEIYIFTSGEALCEWGDERFTAGSGTVTHCPPNLPHAMRVTSDEPLRAYIIGWAPGGDRAALNSPSQLLQDPPVPESYRSDT